MTHFPNASSGTESSSVSVAAPSLHTGSDHAVAAFLMRAINSLSLAQGAQPAQSAPQEQPAAAAVQAQVAASVPAVAAPAPIGFLSSGPWVAGSLYIVVPTGPMLPIAEPEYALNEGPTWYCIIKGNYVGLTLSNALALRAIVGVSGNQMKGYKTQAAALAAFNEMRSYGFVVVVP